MTDPINNFSARQVENGWIVSVNAPMGCMGRDFVFTTLANLGEWLKAQVEIDPARSRNG